jgi:hypothetical protein
MLLKNLASPTWRAWLGEEAASEEELRALLSRVHLIVSQFSDPTPRAVMAGLVPAIHGLGARCWKTWIPGTRPGMTGCVFEPMNLCLAVYPAALMQAYPVDILVGNAPQQ